MTDTNVAPAMTTARVLNFIDTLEWAAKELGVEDYHHFWDNISYDEGIPNDSYLSYYLKDDDFQYKDMDEINNPLKKLLRDTYNLTEEDSVLFFVCW